MMFLSRDFLEFSIPCDGYLVAFKIKMIGNHSIKYTLYDSSSSTTPISGRGTIKVDENSTLIRPLRVHKDRNIRLHSDTNIDLFQAADTSHGEVTLIGGSLISTIPMVGIALYFKGRITSSIS